MTGYILVVFGGKILIGCGNKALSRRFIILHHRIHHTVASGHQTVFLAANHSSFFFLPNVLDPFFPTLPFPIPKSTHDQWCSRAQAPRAAKTACASMLHAVFLAVAQSCAPLRHMHRCFIGSLSSFLCLPFPYRKLKKVGVCFSGAFCKPWEEKLFGKHVQHKKNFMMIFTLSFFLSLSNTEKRCYIPPPLVLFSFGLLLQTEWGHIRFPGPEPYNNF